MLRQNNSHPNRCHIIALFTLMWTSLLSSQEELGGESHSRRWLEVSTHQDEALEDFKIFLDVESSGIEWGLCWTLRKLYLTLCELARGKAQRQATAAVELIRVHLQRTGSGCFLLHLVLVNAVNSLLLTTENMGHATIHGLPEWDAKYAEPLLQYLEGSLRKEDTCVPHHQRQMLLNVLRPHVFHRNVKIRKSLTQLLQDPYQRNRLPDDVEMDKVEKEMAALRLKIDSACRVPGAGRGCQWREMRGKADLDGGRMAVQVHFYSHSLDCLRREMSGRCSEAGPLLRAFDIRLSLEARPFLTAVLQHEEHDLARLHVQASHAAQQRLIHPVLEQRQGPMVEAKELFARWTIEVVQALEYLHGKGIVLVDLSVHSLVLHESKVKVVNFDSALRWKTDKDSSVEATPMRWLAPESLLEGRFSPASDVLALGRLLYQVWTGGLEPYGELYTADTDIVLNALSDCIPLHNWSCIPTKIYSIIKSCNAPEAKRLPRLSVLKNDLERFRAALPEIQEGSSAKWPELDVHQIARNHVPEKAKASQIERIQQRNRQGDELFQSDEKVPPPKWDSLTIIKELSGTVVYEPMTAKFVDDWWSRLRDLHVPELGGLSSCPQPEAFRQYEKYMYRQRRVYQESRTLQEEAEALREVASPPARVQQMLPLLLQLAEALEQLHAEGWVYCDLSPRTVLVTSSDKKILFHRLGRMRMYRRDENDTTHKYIRFQDISDRERFPPETVQASEYGPYSEVFVFAVTAWEVLESLKPRQSAGTDGVRVKPELCDDRVFQVLQRCWGAKAHRPTMNHVATELGNILRAMGLTIIPRMVPLLPNRPSYSPSCESSSSSAYVSMTEYLPHFRRGGGDSISSGDSRSFEAQVSSAQVRRSTSNPVLSANHGQPEDVANRRRSRMDRYQSDPNVSPALPDTRVRRRQRSREIAQAPFNNANSEESDGDSAAESDRHITRQGGRRRPPLLHHFWQIPVHRSSGADTGDGLHRSPRGGS